MNGCFYSQKTEEQENRKYYIGEDAIPFVGKGYFFVADGSGGGACSHDDVDKGFLTDQSVRAEMLSISFPEDQDDFHKTYMEKSFRELDEMKDYPPITMDIRRSGGYFASRIMSCILVDLFRHDQDLDQEAFFRELDTCASVEEKQTKSEEFAKLLKEKLLSRLRDAALKVNLNDRMRDPNKELLLATTLSLVLYHEKDEDTVDVVCLSAGDSRLYALLSDGAVQLTEDDENKDGAVTQYVNLSRSFRVKANYYSFKTPFILFGVSDGCFDWVHDIHPNTLKELGYENQSLEFSLLIEYKVLHEPFFISESPDEVEENWKRFISSKTSDDSASLAYQTFGLDSLDDVKHFLSQRNAQIHEFWKYSDPIEFDYCRDLVESRAGREKHEKIFYRSKRSQFLSDPKVLEYIETREQTEPSESTRERCEELETQLDRKKKEREQHRKDIETMTEKYWIEIRPLMQTVDKISRMKQTAGMQTEADALASKIRSLFDTKRENLEKHLITLRIISEKADALRLKTEALSKISEQDEDGLISLDYDTRIDELETIESDMNEMHSEVRKSCTSLREYDKASREYLGCYARLRCIEGQILEDRAGDLLRDMTTAGLIPDNCPEEIRTKFIRKLEAIKECTIEIESLEKKIRETVNECARESAEQNYNAILDHFVDDEEASSELEESLSEWIQKIRESRNVSENLREKCIAQIDLCIKTDIACLRLLKGEKNA